MQIETSKSMIRTIKRMCGSYYAPGIFMAIFIMSICVVENVRVFTTDIRNNQF